MTFPPALPPTLAPGHRRPGYTLVEVMVVTVILGVLAAMAVPSYRRAVEQGRADQAAANLRTLWAAERLYYLDQQTYTADPSELVSLEVLDAREIQILSSSLTFIMHGDSSYIYMIDHDRNGVFDIIADRAADAAFTGRLMIDDSGTVNGELTDGRGTVIRPGFR